MLLWAVQEEMKKRHEPKSVFSHTVMSLDSGILKTNALSFGILFNGRKNYGEHFRVFPISNWTELDVWEYIKLENIELPSLYFSHQRDCVVRDGVILANSEFIKLKPGEKVVNMTIRYRTCGDMPITGAVESQADDLTKIIEEIATTRTTERGGRADDKRAETAMEDRKKQGYF